MPSLLTQAEQANKKPGRPVRSYSKEEIDLCRAWADDAVSITQVGTAMKMNRSTVYHFLAQGLKIYLQGLLR